MTVRELIGKLSGFPLDIPVYIFCGSEGGADINIGLDADGREVYINAYEEDLPDDFDIEDFIAEGEIPDAR